MLIILKTKIAAPVERVFDLSRDIDLHQQSTQQTMEKAIGGITTGLIGSGQSVTWRAKHFGVWQTFTSKITEFKAPYYFVDEMTQGVFKSFRHEHYFENNSGDTLMIDKLYFKAPLEILGRLTDRFILKPYLTRFILQRNNFIKVKAEHNQPKEE